VADLPPLSARLLHGMDFAKIQADLDQIGVPADIAPAFWEMARENINKRADLADLWALCRDGADPVIAEEDAEYVAQAMALLPERPWDLTTWGEWTKAVKEATGRKGRGLFMPLRQALTGMSHGPDMSKLLPLLQTLPEIE
ncbi:MAG TPA: glutamate--tRNA ligase, partial [Paracoccaceae bacterium]|nr:glutamate--tRNA ligase [Paracoccaceae bacterium]